MRYMGVVREKVSRRVRIDIARSRECERSFKNAFNPLHVFAIRPQYTVVDFILQTKFRDQGGRVITSLHSKDFWNSLLFAAALK